MTEIVTRFLALLTITADLLLVGALVILFRTRRKGDGERYSELREIASEYALLLAWLVALTATLGSLYYSEVANFIPCKLCWYQRIAMYPLALILGIAAMKKDWSVRRYVIPMVAIGASVSIYHYMVERFPDLAGSSCDPAAPCSFLWVWEFHFISIPFQALSAFALIGALMFLMPRPDSSHPSATSEDSEPRTAELVHP